MLLYQWWIKKKKVAAQCLACCRHNFLRGGLFSCVHYQPQTLLLTPQVNSTHILKTMHTHRCVFSQTSPIGHLTWNLPEFFHWRLLFLSSGQMTRIIDRKKHNVPVCWKPCHEKWTVEVLISNFYNLCGSNPRRRNWQDDQESPDGLQNHGRAGQAASLDSVFLAAVLRMRLRPIVPWKQERNTNV